VWLERTGVYRVFVGKSVGKGSLERPKRKWGVIKMDLQEVECRGVDWNGLVQDRDRWLVLVTAVR